jgi:hypothetical protein
MLSLNSQSVNKTPLHQPTKMMIASPNLYSKFTPSVTISKSPSMSKRTSLGSGIFTNSNLESKNILLRLAGKEPQAQDKTSILQKYASKPIGQNNQLENVDEGTDENVSVNNVRGIPITRKHRHNLRDIENKKESLKFDYDNLPITPAVKYQKKE